MTTVHVNACIVGGGPAGMMLGLLLAKRGAQVLVLEGHETFEREFRGEVLQPSTAHLPTSSDCSNTSSSAARCASWQGAAWAVSEKFGELSFKRIAGVSLRDLDAAAVFLAALLRKAEPFPSFQCWMGAKVTKLIQEDGRTVGVQGFAMAGNTSRCAPTSSWAPMAAITAIAKMGGFKAEYDDIMISI